MELWLGLLSLIMSQGGRLLSPVQIIRILHERMVPEADFSEVNNFDKLSV